MFEASAASAVLAPQMDSAPHNDFAPQRDLLASLVMLAPQSDFEAHRHWSPFKTAALQTDPAPQRDFAPQSDLSPQIVEAPIERVTTPVVVSYSAEGDSAVPPVGTVFMFCNAAWRSR